MKAVQQVLRSAGLFKINQPAGDPEPWRELTDWMAADVAERRQLTAGKRVSVDDGESGCDARPR